MKTLPSQNHLNITVFSRLFDATTTSYKFLWMLGILQILGEEPDKLIIPAKDIVIKMLNLAIPPLCQFHLYFGAEDKMAEYIGMLQSKSSLSISSLFDTVESVDNGAINNITKRLTRFVPQQLLSPFFKHDLAQFQKSHARAKEIRRLAAIKFNEKNPPPYRIESSGNPHIELHPLWQKYFTHHNGIVRGWTLYHWINYLQARNPHTPAIINKIAHPETRDQITAERAWWRVIIAHTDKINCIYSGTPIKAGDSFHLDHYIPWSFIGHNRLWNLIPVTQEANVRKQDNLPKSEKYFDRFVKTQHRALSIYANAPHRSKIAEAYIEDLKIHSLPPSLAELRKKYNLVIPPLMALAKNNGFSTDWDYDRATKKSAQLNLYQTKKD